ncbi:hypothetical protein [Streptomyces sp. NPDC006267]|uniref:hypothetical protein n=1 Tax=Streptomyces sp. NPDC006267 TaxID=3157173 RepID=UPI0033A2D476
MTTRALPPVTTLTEAQQRGWACVWCRQPLGIGLGVDLNEQKVRPTSGAAYSWFPRACLDSTACQQREVS